MENDITKDRIKKAVEEIKNKISILDKDIESAKLLIASLEQKKKEEEIKLSALTPFIWPVWKLIKYNDEKPIPSLEFFDQEAARDEIVSTLKEVKVMRSWDLAEKVIKWNQKYRDMAHNIIRSMAAQGIIVMIPEPWRERNFAYQLNINS